MKTSHQQGYARETKSPPFRKLLLPAGVLLLSWILLTTWFSAIAAPDTLGASANSNESLAPNIDLTITKSSSPLTFTVGSDNKYILRVSATGTITQATQIKVTDPLPTGLSIASIEVDTNIWDCGTSTTTELICDFTGSITPPAILPAIVINVNVASSVAPTVINTAYLFRDGNIVPSSSSTISTPVDSVDLRIDKTVSPTYADIGDTVTYNITIYNNGPATARNIVVTDTLTTDLTYGSWNPTPSFITDTYVLWNINSLGKNQSQTFTFTGVPTASALGKRIDNTASVSSANKSDWNTTNNEDTAFFYVSGLGINKTVDRTEAFAGEPINFFITLENAAAQSTSSIRVTDIFSQELTIIAVDDVPYNGTNTFRPALFSLAPGAQRTFKVTAIGNDLIPYDIEAFPPITTTVITNTASYQSGFIVGQTQPVNVLLKSAADLGISKTNAPAELTPGESFSYTISIRNNGNITTSNLVFTDMLSTYLEFLALDKSGLSMTQTFTSTNQLVRTWDIGGELAPGELISFKINARVANTTNAIGQNVFNTVLVSGDAFEGYLDNNEYTTALSEVAAPPLGEQMAIDKSVSPSQATIGESFFFTIRVRNSGDEQAQGVVVYDRFPTVLDITGAATTLGSATTNASTREVTVNIGTLNVNQVVTITVSARVNNSVNASASYVNTAELRWNPNLNKNSNNARYRIVVSTLPGTGGAGPQPASPANMIFLSLGALLLGMGLIGILISVWARRNRPLWAQSYTNMGLILLVIGAIGIITGFILQQDTLQTPQIALQNDQLLAPLPTFTPTAELRPTNTPEPLHLIDWGPTPTPERLPDYPVPTPTLPPGAEEQEPDTSPVVRIIIPALAVDTVVKYVPYDGRTWLIGGLKQEVAWMGDTSWPGLGGNTGLAGHLDLADGSSGPFGALSDLNVGEEIIVYTEENMYFYNMREQTVVEDYDLSVIEPTTKPQLTLITCTGWDADLRLYLKRLVVFADLAETRPIPR